MSDPIMKARSLLLRAQRTYVPRDGDDRAAILEGMARDVKAAERILTRYLGEADPNHPHEAGRISAARRLLDEIRALGWS